MVVYKDPSPQFKPRIEVAALFIEDGDRILLLHRHHSTSQGNRWGIPGGKVDKGETPLCAAIREVKEETGYDFSRHPVDHLGTVFIEYDDKNHFVYHMFRTQLVGDPTAVKINLDEHVAFVWATPQEGLKLPLIQDEDACFKLVYSL
jgi:8-oxo-dGTP pyrophosphatase MutT (NUDIX family)